MSSLFWKLFEGFLMAPVWIAAKVADGLTPAEAEAADEDRMANQLPMYPGLF